MPDFAIVSLKDAKLQTTSGRQRTYLNEYAGYIQQLAPGMAGKLHLLEGEKPTTMRRRLAVAAQALGTKLVIKRAGDDVYFWSEPSAEEQPQRRRGRRRQSQEEAAMLDLPLAEPESPLIH
jgi:hypothetical protein